MGCSSRRAYLVVPCVKRRKGREMTLHLGLGEILQQRIQLFLLRWLLRKDGLGCAPGAESAEVGIIGDVEEALASLGRCDTGQSSP